MRKEPRRSKGSMNMLQSPDTRIANQGELPRFHDESLTSPQFLVVRRILLLGQSWSCDNALAIPIARPQLPR